tara:strand:+ start:3885 stop:4238 length:354 start_codon:yes stop_codon:yes gene_type:complete
MIKSFKDLVVWQKSFNLVQDVYAATEQLPQSELYGLSSQIRRSAVSIPSNIAEGSKRSTSKDYIQFLRVAYGSSAELETQLLLAKALYNIEVDDPLGLVEEIQKMLQSLITKLITKT